MELTIAFHIIRFNCDFLDLDFKYIKCSDFIASETKNVRHG